MISFVLRADEPLSLQFWIPFHQRMIMSRSDDVLRAKGILRFEELDYPMVLQAVRELYTFDAYEGSTRAARNSSSSGATSTSPSTAKPSPGSPRRNAPPPPAKADRPQITCRRAAIPAKVRQSGAEKSSTPGSVP